MNNENKWTYIHPLVIPCLHTVYLIQQKINSIIIEAKSV